MSTLKTDLLIFLALLSGAIIIALALAGQNAIDIQIHDTYYLLDRTSLTVLILGPIIFLFFLVRSYKKRFRSIPTNLCLLIGLFLIALITYYVILFQQSSLEEYTRLNFEKTVIADAKAKINRSWAVFAFLMCASIALIGRTIMIWNSVEKKDDAS